jgi:hypothetical protein
MSTESVFMYVCPWRLTIVALYIQQEKRKDEAPQMPVEL